MTELLHSLGINWPVMVAQLVNFAILLAVLTKFVYKPVMRMLDERREGVRLSLEKEEKIAAKFAEADAEKEKILSEARTESQKIIDEARQDGEEVKKKLTTAAKEEIAKMQAENSKKLSEERARLVTEVKREIGALVVSTIEQTLGDVLDARAQGKMVEQALSILREGQGSKQEKSQITNHKSQTNSRS